MATNFMEMPSSARRNVNLSVKKRALNEPARKPFGDLQVNEESPKGDSVALNLKPVKTDVDNNLDCTEFTFSYLEPKDNNNNDVSLFATTHENIVNKMRCEFAKTPERIFGEQEDYFGGLSLDNSFEMEDFATFLPEKVLGEKFGLEDLPPFYLSSGEDSFTRFTPD